MSFINYLKDKLLIILIQILPIVAVTMLLLVLKINTYIILLMQAIMILSIIIIHIVEFVERYSYYKNVQQLLEKLDKKYLLSEIITKPSFYEGRLMYEIVKESNKSMNDEISKYRVSSDEYREYVETWVHEIKNPIASLGLIIENNKNSVTSSIKEELDLVEKYVEQALFYSRSNNVEKDYIIKKILLKDIVNNVIKKNSKMLIQTKIQIEISDINYFVYTDEKWTNFIISQIIDNSIKYKCNTDSKIILSATEENSKIILSIKDNGIGIDKCDENKVFEKGFTGNNGRNYVKSTGIGLYLCRKLCQKIGLGIFLESNINCGTVVKIVFPKTNIYSIK